MNKALTNEQRLRVALLGYRSHPHVGGQGIYLHYLSKALAEAGHEVVVFSGPPYPELACNVRLVKIPGMDLYAKEKPLRSLRLQNFFSLTDMYEWFSKLTGGFAEPHTFGKRLLNQHLSELQNFNVIHDNQSLCYSLLALQKKGCNVVATIHHPIHRDRELALDSAINSGQALLIKRWYSFLNMQEKVVARLKHIVTVSELSRQDILNYFGIDDSAVSVIPNGIDTKIFKPCPEIVKFPFRIITTASSDQALKGLHILFEAFSIIHSVMPHAELVVIGKLKEKSLAQEAHLKLTPSATRNIHFISGISTEELVEQYAQAKIAVCPSLYEGFGLPALEAMACGLPLVCSNGGALPEVVGDAALVVEAGNSAVLAKSCISLLQSETIQKDLSTKGLARVQEHFCWRHIAERYLNFYKSSLTINANT